MKQNQIIFQIGQAFARVRDASDSIRSKHDLNPFQFKQINRIDKGLDQIRGKVFDLLSNGSVFAENEQGIKDVESPAPFSDSQGKVKVFTQENSTGDTQEISNGDSEGTEEHNTGDSEGNGLTQGISNGVSSGNNKKTGLTQENSNGGIGNDNESTGDSAGISNRGTGVSNGGSGSSGGAKESSNGDKGVSSPNKDVSTTKGFISVSSPVVVGEKLYSKWNKINSRLLGSIGDLDKLSSPELHKVFMGIYTDYVVLSTKGKSLSSPAVGPGVAVTGKSEQTGQAEVRTYGLEKEIKSYSRCGSCDRVFKTEGLEPVKHMLQRVSSGSVLPSGECPECGALCHICTDLKGFEPDSGSVVEEKYSRCDNCFVLWRDEDLITAKQAYWLGNAVPSGLCPNCGTLCYSTTDRKWFEPLVKKWIRDTGEGKKPYRIWVVPVVGTDKMDAGDACNKVWGYYDLYAYNRGHALELFHTLAKIERVDDFKISVMNRLNWNSL